MKNNKFKWNVTGMLGMGTNVGSKRLAVLVYPDSGVIVALETQVDADISDPQGKIEKIFSNHAHQVIGTEPGIPQAIARAEAYAAAWIEKQKSGDKTFDACECQDIEARPRE